LTGKKHNKQEPDAEQKASPEQGQNVSEDAAEVTARAEDNVAEDSVAAEVSNLTEQLSAMQEENARLKDGMLRTHAEMENLRKRTQREVADAHKFGIEKFATALLDVVDNLERALAAEAGNEDAVRQGIELTLNSWHDLMTRFEVKRIDAMGEMFDPHQHEALSQMPSDEPEGMVIAQHVAGYSLHGRLIRPARVLVSSGPAK